jgi:hypothetical protein
VFHGLELLHLNTLAVYLPALKPVTALSQIGFQPQYDTLPESRLERFRFSGLRFEVVSTSAPEAV